MLFTFTLTQPHLICAWIYASAIAQELSLPPGSTVDVILDESGLVQYEITVPSDSTPDANVAVSGIQTTLSQTSTMASITTSVDTASQASADPEVAAALANASVDSNSVGTTTTPTTSNKITVEGELAVSGFDPTALNNDQLEEAKGYFGSALTQQLESEGLLPDGASVVVIGIEDNGTVLYEVHYYGKTSQDASASMTIIDSALADSATLSAIASSKFTHSALRQPLAYKISSLTPIHLTPYSRLLI